MRSYVEQQKVTREKPRGWEGYGALRRPMSRKRMTVEMEEPFVWPEEPEDFSPYVLVPGVALCFVLIAFNRWVLIDGRRILITVHKKCNRNFKRKWALIAQQKPPRSSASCFPNKLSDYKKAKRGGSQHGKR